MTPIDTFERRLPTALTDLAAPVKPDYLTDILGRTAATRQRPAWASIEGWLPVELVTTRVPTTRLPLRQLGVLALIAILLAAILAVYIGSRQQRLPEPFGPAANGVIALGRQGDLFIVDPRSARETLILGGPQTDEWIGFTPDGTHGLFIRWGPDSGAMTAARVGSVALSGDEQPVFVDKDVIHQGDWIEPAPNSLGVAFTAFEFGTPNYQISVAALDGSTYRTFYEVPITDYGGLAFLAPEGRELVYLARSANGQTHDIRALDVVSGKTRAILETGLHADVFGNVSAAPDGKRIAYALRNDAGEIQVHVVGADGRDDTLVGHAPGATFEAWPQWDPQGRRLLIERDAGDGVVRPVIVDLAGGPDVVVDTVISHNGAGKQWAPDGTSILSQRTAADGKQLQQELWDTRTGKVSQVSWPSDTGPAWQRLAP